MATTWRLTAADALIALMVLALCFAIKPLRRLARFGLSVATGWAGLWVLNSLGAAVHFHLPLNPITATVTAITGIPGVVALAVLQRLWGRI